MPLRLYALLLSRYNAFMDRFRHMLGRYLQAPDIPFSREDATRYLPWVVAVMVCLACLLLAAGISLHQASSRSGQLNLRSFQVHVPHQHTALMGEIMADLRAHSEVETVEVLTSETLQDLLEPWTQGELALKELPLPQVIEVALASNIQRSEKIAAITQQLKSRNQAIEVESYQSWMQEFSHFTQTLRMGVFLLTFLLIAALMALVYVVVRTSLMLHFPSVRLLHHLGANDVYIIRQFIRNGCLMILKGSAMGAGLASMLAVMLSSLSRQQASPILPELTLGWMHGVMFVSLPVLMLLGTALLVHVTMKQLLGQLN